MTTVAYPFQQTAFVGDRRHTQPVVNAWLYKPTAEDEAMVARVKRSKARRDTDSIDSQFSIASTISIIKRKFGRAKH